MDVKCKYCHEPFDVWELRNSMNCAPSRAFALFEKYGCGFIEHAWNGKQLKTCADNDTATQEATP